MSRCFAVVGLLVAAVGCVHRPPVVTERRPDGTIHLKCQKRLPECLDEVENLCERHKYVVLRAFDARDLKGVVPQQTLMFESEAYVRCETTWQWDQINKALVSSPTSPPPAVPTPVVPVRACTPGATQACVGPAGCTGGQVCAPDGSRFGPCDCGPAAAPAPAPAPAP